ncbi:MAG: tetratricopeptide repeat protein [Bacteroidales bacterium]
MKRIVLILLTVLMVSALFGQTNKRTSAFNYHRYGKLDLAKEAIDDAAKHDKTINDARTWFYRGNIYYDIAMSSDENFRNLDPDPLGVALESYKKAKEYDSKNEYTDDIERFTLAIGEGYYNQGVIDYNNEDFKGAAISFEKSFDVSLGAGRVDTSALYNAAVAAVLGQETEMAKGYYERVLELEYYRPDIYATLAEIYKSEGDTALALATVVEGRELFPEDFNLLIAETNVYLTTEENEKAISNLEIAKEIDKTNQSIFFAVGTIYDQMGDVDKAIDAYEQAIGLDPDYFEANYNLGALYVNMAADILDKANNLPLDAVKEYEEQTKLANDMLKKSIPYLEKSLELMPDDLNTLVSLKEIYTRLGMMEKLAEIDLLLKNE